MAISSEGSIALDSNDKESIDSMKDNIDTELKNKSIDEGSQNDRRVRMPNGKEMLMSQIPTRPHNVRYNAVAAGLQSREGDRDNEPNNQGSASGLLRNGEHRPTD